MKPALTTRATISFPPELYRNIEQLAKEKKVSLAWIIRDAAEKYIAEQHQSVKKNYV